MSDGRKTPMVLSIADIYTLTTRSINAAYRAGQFDRARMLEIAMLDIAYLHGATR